MNLIYKTAFLFLLSFFVAQASEKQAAPKAKYPEGLYAEIETTKGTIVCNLTFRKTPITVSNFVGLAEGKIENTSKDLGKPYFEGIVFHRVIPNFMVQVGDPTGTGRGGPGYNFPDEFDPSLKHSRAGTLSMANAGPFTNGSQFFITHVPTPHLDGKHSVFGYVHKGQDVVNKIVKGDKIVKINIVRVGKVAKEFVANQKTFQEFILKKYFKYDYSKAKISKSGLMYQVLKDGKGGASPKMGQKVVVHYTGMLMNGKKFDSSHDRGQPATFNVGGLIPGWNEALMGMTRGEKRLLVIPPRLGYGRRGIRGVIPPNAVLKFEMELLEF